jgi:transposase InsO family protein
VFYLLIIVTLFLRLLLIWCIMMYGALRLFPLFVIFVDDYSRYIWLYILQNRYELPKIYSEFQKMDRTQFSQNINFFHSDNAMEYRESTFLSTLKQNGTLPHRSSLNTSQQNGRVERKHRHILDTFREKLLLPLFTPLIGSRLPLLSIGPPMNSCTVLLPITNPFASLAVSVLCFFHLMNAQN